ncbi:hypothetical protein BJ165DRAFT_1529151 [Panaeolus papilionaceus]|nr:hypothetical protein BJ165DRAFT_1529151 [Panaeolus papilionaceus]
MENTGSSHPAVFTADVWETIIDFIPDSPRRTLVSLSCSNRELCIMLRRRIFNKVVFTISRNTKQESHQLEPCWSAAPRLLTVIQSRPVIAECVKHLEIQVFMAQMSTSRRGIWYYDDFSITRLVRYLTKLQTLSFVMSTSPGLITWSSLPEQVRSAVHPLLHQVPDLRLEQLKSAFAASTRMYGQSALESLAVTPFGTFQVGDTFPTAMTSGNTAAQPEAPRPHPIKSLTIDLTRFSRFADWLTVDNPAFPITINHVEKLVFIGLHQVPLTPEHGFYRVLQRCGKVLKRLEVIPTHLGTGSMYISVKASVDDIESQRQIYSGRCPDLSPLISLSFLRINGASIGTYRHAKPQKNFSTSIPYIIKTLKTLPCREGQQPSLRNLHLDLGISEFKDYLLKQVDWTDLVDFLLNDPRFVNLKQVFIDVTYIYDSSENSNYERIRRVRPPRFIKRVLEGDEQLMTLRHRRGLVLGSTAEDRYPGG